MIHLLSSFLLKISNKVGFTIFFITYIISFYLYFLSGFPFSIKNIISYNTDRYTSADNFFYSPETFFEAYNKSGIPDLQYFNSGSDIYRTLQKFGQEGRRKYEYILLADIIYPTIYGFFYSVLLTLILKTAFPGDYRLWMLNALPFAATLLDYVENAAIIQIVIAFPSKFRNIGSLPGYFTLLKHIFLIASEMLIIIGIIIILYRKFRPRESLEPVS